jgi:hypothetical protein
MAAGWISFTDGDRTLARDTQTPTAPNVAYSATQKRHYDSSIACSIQESDEVSSTSIQRKRSPVEFFGSFYRDQHTAKPFLSGSRSFSGWISRFQMSS